jgi:hypothetical protein
MIKKREKMEREKGKKKREKYKRKRGEGEGEPRHLASLNDWIQIKLLINITGLR